MLVSSIIEVERFSNSSLNVNISSGNIICFHYIIWILYICKVVISKTITSDCGW